MFPQTTQCTQKRDNPISQSLTSLRLTHLPESLKKVRKRNKPPLLKPADIEHLLAQHRESKQNLLSQFPKPVFLNQRSKLNLLHNSYLSETEKSPVKQIPRQIPQINQRDIIPLNIIAMSQLNQGNHKSAAKILKNVSGSLRQIESQSKNSVSDEAKTLTLNNMACLNLKLKRPRAAYKILHQAKELSPDDQQVRLNLSTALSLLGRHNQALDSATIALKRGKGNNEPLCLYNIAVELEHLGKFEKALHILYRVKSMAVDSSAFLCLVDNGIAELQTKIQKKN